MMETYTTQCLECFSDRYYGGYRHTFSIPGFSWSDISDDHRPSKKLVEHAILAFARAIQRRDTEAESK